MLSRVGYCGGMVTRTADCASWWAREQIVFLACLPKLLPRNRSGRRVHVASVYRWVNPGLHGVCLRAFMVGGRMATTKEEVDRFFASLTRGGSPGAREGLTQELQQRGLA